MVLHHVPHPGEQLGNWVDERRRQRKRGKLNPELEQELEQLPGWTWEVCHKDTSYSGHPRVCLHIPGEVQVTVSCLLLATSKGASDFKQPYCTMLVCASFQYVYMCQALTGLAM